MSTTLLPFLYQTRALRGLASRTPQLRAFLLHSRPSSTYNNSNKTQKHEHIPFELPPDFEPPESDHSAADATAQQRSTITPTEREAFNRIFEDIAARGKARPAGTSGSGRLHHQATVESERSSSSSGGIGDGDGKVTDASREQPDPRRGLAAINIIVQKAARSQGSGNSANAGQLNPRRQQQPLDHRTISADAEQQHDALLRFPPSLRRAASLALGVIEPMESDDGEVSRRVETASQAPLGSISSSGSGSENVEEFLDPLAKSVSVELMRRPERIRVEKKMLEAKTDMELWDVMEEEVFSMVYKLGIGREQQKRGRRGASTTTTVISADSESRPNNGTLSMDIYGPLYPSYLLLGLRLLDRQFERSSPLALNVLLRIKQLGLASYFLGASMPFYNSLLAIYWFRYGDVVTMVDLLEEIRQAGLSMDEESLRVVKSAEDFLKAHAKDPDGSFLKQLVQMPEYDSAADSSLRHWVTTISTQIHERRQELRA